jgi:hypothetical protein
MKYYERKALLRSGEIMSEEIKTIANGQCMEYKGKPLVRSENTICYGDMSDKYVLLLTIMNYKEVKGNQIPDKVLVQILKTDPSLSQYDRIEKQDMKDGLFEAFDIGIIWLERLLG